MMGLDVERLRVVAEAATPGAWSQCADTPWGSKVIVNTSGEMFLGVSAQTAMPTEGWSSSARARAVELGKSKCADAAYIATFDPPTVLALLDRLAAAEATVARVKALADAAVAARDACRESPACECAYKDCYECGKWHDCHHTTVRVAQIRAALGGDGGGMGPSIEGDDA